MNTIIQTESSATLHLVLRAQELTLEKSLSKLEDLSTVLIEHGEDEDPFSKKLFSWGEKLLNHIHQTQLSPSEKFLSDSLKKLEKILQDPFTRQRITDPVLVETKVGPMLWEKETFKRYEELSLRIFRRKINAKPHLFAEKVLTLLQPGKKGVPQQQMPLVYPSGIINQADVEELLKFEKNIDLVQVEKEQEKQLKTLTMISRVLQQNLEKNKEEFERDIRLFEELEQQRTEEIKSGLNQIKKDYQESSKITQGLLTSAKQELKTTKIELGEAKKENLNQKAQINQLWSQIHGMQSQIHSMSNNNNDGCTIL